MQEHGTRPQVGVLGRRTGLVVALAAAVLAADHLTKAWAVRALTPDDIDLVWTLRLHLTRNRGAAFSFTFASGGVIAILAVVVVIVLIAMGRSLTTRLGILSLGLVLGGALGNLADRAFRDADGFLGGAVVDFVDFQWWPVFNVADAAVVIGGLLLVFTSSKAP